MRVTYEFCFDGRNILICDFDIELDANERAYQLLELISGTRLRKTGKPIAILIS